MPPPSAADATSPETVDYQPMHVNFGLVPPLVQRTRGKRERYAAYSTRAQEVLRATLAQRPDLHFDYAQVAVAHLREARRPCGTEEERT